MVDRFKEFLDITFKGKARFKSVSTDLSRQFIKSIYAFMRPFIETTGKRVRNKCWFKNWIKYSKYGMVKNAVSNNGFMNMPLFRITDIERRISSVLVFFTL